MFYVLNVGQTEDGKKYKRKHICWFGDQEKGTVTQLKAAYSRTTSQDNMSNLNKHTHTHVTLLPPSVVLRGVPNTVTAERILLQK